MGFAASSRCGSWISLALYCLPPQPLAQLLGSPMATRLGTSRCRLRRWRRVTSQSSKRAARPLRHRELMRADLAPGSALDVEGELQARGAGPVLELRDHRLLDAEDLAGSRVAKVLEFRPALESHGAETYDTCHRRVNAEDDRLRGDTCLGSVLAFPPMSKLPSPTPRYVPLHEKLKLWLEFMAEHYTWLTQNALYQRLGLNPQGSVFRKKNPRPGILMSTTLDKMAIATRRDATDIVDAIEHMKLLDITIDGERVPKPEAVVSRDR